MPRKPCRHERLLVEPSVHPQSVGFHKVLERRKASKSASKDGVPKDISVETFPAPLVLPDDELSWDPNYPPQSVTSWVREPYRNPVTQKRKTIYIATIESADFMNGWSQPDIPAEHLPKVNGNFISGLQESDIRDVTEYLQAFYYGMPVKRFEGRPQFTTWSEYSKPSKPKGQLMKTNTPIGLNTDSECIRIRTRPSLDGAFGHQLNLSDLLDVCLSTIPNDAYSLLLLTDLDMYEDEEDDFCCGRAYGGSRVAVVSTARYNPLLDEIQEINRTHSWPASHCISYLDRAIKEAGYSKVNGGPKTKTKCKRVDAASSSTTIGTVHKRTMASDGSPLKAAVQAAASLPDVRSTASPNALRSIWVSRVCRTASHELGHCLGIDHCMYYACNMQGTSSAIEDVRQPPYLCPVDLEKVLRATGTDEKERYEALLKFCERWEGMEGGDMFVAHAAWLRAVLKDMGRNEEIDADIEVMEI